MTARASHILNISLRAVMAVSLAALLVMQPAAHPRRADAVPVAIPLVAGIGIVLATALGVYGVQTVNNNRSVEDVGASFIEWLSTSSTALDVMTQHGISDFREVMNGIYSQALAGQMDLALWTTNEQNAINGVYGALLSAWAADNFGAISSSGSVSIGSYSFNTYYSDATVQTSNGFALNNVPYGFFVDKRSRNVCFLTPNNQSAYGFGISLNPSNGYWRLGVTGSQGGTLGTSATFYMLFMENIGDTVGVDYGAGNITSNTFGNFDEVEFYVNTYYPFYLLYEGNNSLASAVASYNPSTGAWSGNDVTIDPGIEGDIFDKFSDALNQGINDLLNSSIPLGSDYVYNPGTQALEQQGSVPVITDWSNIADWAGVLERLRAGLLDGTNVISNDTTGARANTIDDSVVDGDSIKDWPDDPWKTPSDGVGTIGAALAFTGESISDKFPFSTWKDIQLISNILAVPAVAPEFDLPIIGFDGGGFTTDTVHISLAPFEPVAVLVRLMFLILMVLAVVWLAVRQLKVFAE